MKRIALCLFAASCVLAQSKGAPGPTQAGRAALAKAQATRDSLVAERWNSQRAHLEERDHSQEELERLRDSLESARQDRDIALNEARRVQAQAQAAAAFTAPAPIAKAAGADPLEPVRKQLQDRLRILRERVKNGIDWDRTQRLARVDSSLDLATTAPGVAQALTHATQGWLSEWDFSRAIEERKGPLPRPEGPATQGTLLRVGTLGAWYFADTAVAAAQLRTGQGAQTWEWREDLATGLRRNLSNSLAGQGRLLPIDPGNAPLEGPGVFAVRENKSFLSRIVAFFDFQNGPLHLVALWAARAVMILLVGLGLAVGWIAWQARRRMRREEADASRYTAILLPAFAHEDRARELEKSASDTLAGRLVKTGLSHRDYSPEALEQVCIAQESAEARELEHGLGFLGSVGSNAPFIGLFGTVCGILDAFAALGRAGGGPQAVMGAIAEALIATATGLAVAIPAIWIYNSLQARAKDILDRAKELRILMVAASLEAAARRKN
jgi:biopolymer transport protein ExbB